MRATGPFGAEHSDHRHRWLLCARAANGHADAPPTSVMNSRRFTASAPVLSTERIAHLRIAGDCCVAGFRLGQCLLWVRFGHPAMSAQCPVCPKADMAALAKT